MRLDYQYHHQNDFKFRKQSNLDYRNHAQGEIELVIMLRGACRAKCGNYDSLLSPGDIFMAFPNQPHRYEGSCDVDAYVLIVPVKKYLSAYYNTVMKLIPVRPVLHTGEYDPAVLTMIDSAFIDLSTAPEPVVQGYMMVIFGKLLEAMEFQQRQTGADEALRLVPHKVFSLEQAIEFIGEDELMEVTPKSIRLRKRILNTELRLKEEARLRKAQQ